MTAADTVLINIYNSVTPQGWCESHQPCALALDYCIDVGLSWEMTEDSYLSDDSVIPNNAEKQFWTACGCNARFSELLKVFPMSS